jgi:hypothetical protein
MNMRLVLWFVLSKCLTRAALVMSLALFSCFAAPAAERDLPLLPLLPLPASDVRVVEGDAIFEDALRKLEKELENAADSFGKGLRADVQAQFDDNQMDWKVYFEAEAAAFKPANFWTRQDTSQREYENLYQQNILFAINFRIGQVGGFEAKDATPGRHGKDRKRDLLVEIEEAQYRVNTWTEERFRPRLYRAEKAWDAYRESAALFAAALGWDETLLAGQELTLLEYRLALLLRQKEALFRLKSESEE